jgi:hypothetical protein
MTHRSQVGNNNDAYTNADNDSQCAADTSYAALARPAGYAIYLKIMPSKMILTHKPLTEGRQRLICNACPNLPRWHLLSISTPQLWAQKLEMKGV